MYGGIGGAFFVWPSYAAGGPAGQAYLAWSGALLVRSGGRGQRDFQDAEIQDDADRYACGCDAPVIESRCASDTDRSLSEKIEPG